MKMLSVLVALGLALTAGGCQQDDSVTDGPGDTGNAVPAEGVAFNSYWLTLSPDGDRIAAPCQPPTTCVWNTADGTLSESLRASDPLAWSPAGDLLAAGEVDDGEARIRLIDPDTGVDVATMTSHEVDETTDSTTGVWFLTFSADARLLGSSGGDGSVRLWSTADHTLLREIDPVSDKPNGLALSPDGSQVAVGSGDQPVQVFDTDTGEEITTLEGGGPQPTLAWSPDGRTLATSYATTGPTRFWDTETWAETSTLPESATSIAFAPDSAKVAITVTHDASVRVVDLGSGEVRELTGHEKPPGSVLFSPSGELAYSLSVEDLLSWDIATGSVTAEFELPAESPVE